MSSVAKMRICTLTVLLAAAADRYLLQAEQAVRTGGRLKRPRGDRATGVPYSGSTGWSWPQKTITTPRSRSTSSKGTDKIRVEIHAKSRAS